MRPTLSVDLNRRRLHDIEVPGSFTASGPFTVEVTNHAAPVHVHLHLDDDLSAVARLADGNHYVESEATVAVDVAVDTTGRDSPVTGRLKVATGYGTETQYVDVTVDPTVEKQPVEVDESLSKPNRGERRERQAGPTPGEQLAALMPDGGAVPVLALGAAAILLALVVGYYVSSPVVLVGVGVVIGGVIAALVLALQ